MKFFKRNDKEKKRGHLAPPPSSTSSKSQTNNGNSSRGTSSRHLAASSSSNNKNNNLKSPTHLTTKNGRNSQDNSTPTPSRSIGSISSSITRNPFDDDFDPHAATATATSTSARHSSRSPRSSSLSSTLSRSSLPSPRSPSDAAKNLSHILKKLYQHETYAYAVRRSTNTSTTSAASNNHTNNNNGTTNPFGEDDIGNDISIVDHDDDDDLDIDEYCRQIVEAMTVDVHQVILQREGSRALELLATLDDSDREMICSSTRRSIPILLNVMEQFPDEVEVQDHASAALAVLTQWEDNARAVLEIENGTHLEEVLVAMEEFPAHERIPASGLAILSNVATAYGTTTVSDGGKDGFHSTNPSFPKTLTNAIPTILQLLKDYRDDPTMCEMGLSALVHLTHGNPMAQVLLAKQPAAIRVLIEALHKQRVTTTNQYDDDNDDDDQEEEDGKDEYGAAYDRHDAVKLDHHQRKNIRLYALQILENVASHPSLEVKGKIVLQGGVARIVEVLRLLAATPPPETDVTKGRISEVESSASELMIAVYSSAETETLIAALQTLVHLSTIGNAGAATGRPGRGQISSSPTAAATDETKRHVAKSSVKIVLTIIRQYNVVNTPDAHEILIQSFYLLRNLSTAEDQGRGRRLGTNHSLAAELITSQGGISTVLVCMREHTEDATIQEQACATLANLLLFTNNSAGGYDVIQSLNAEDGLSTMFQIIRLHQANLAVQEQAFGALYYLVCSKDLLPSQKKDLLLEENVLVVIATMNQYIDVSELLCTRGSGLILLLSAFAGSRSSPAKDAIVSVGGISIILKTMRRHGLSVEVQEYLTGTLRGLCLDDKYIGEFVDLEGISTVLAAMLIHPLEAAIQAYGCDLLIHVAKADPSYKQSISEGNGRSVAADAVARHKDNRTVQSRGTALLHFLS